MNPDIRTVPEEEIAKIQFKLGEAEARHYMDPETRVKSIEGLQKQTSGIDKS